MTPRDIEAIERCAVWAGWEGAGANSLQLEYASDPILLSVLWEQCREKLHREDIETIRADGDVDCYMQWWRTVGCIAATQHSPLDRLAALASRLPQ